MSSEPELENTGLALTSGTAGTLLIFSVLILNIPKCQSKALLNRMQGQEFWKRKTCTMCVAERTCCLCLAVIQVEPNVALYRDEFACFTDLCVTPVE